MIQVYAVGRVVDRREVIGYKLLSLEDYNVHDYSIEKIEQLLKGGNTIGNLYWDKKEQCVKEYYCERTLTEYTKAGKRIGKGKDTFLTVNTDSCQAGLSHYHSYEVYYSKDGIVESNDMLNLNYVEHYDVDNLSECMPFMHKEPIDMYVKNFMAYYRKISESEEYQKYGLSFDMNNMGMLRARLEHNLDTLSIDFCRAFEDLHITSDVAVKNLMISDACGAILPESIKGLKLDSVVVGNTSLCSNSFVNCNIGMVNLQAINRNSKDNIFKNCKVSHLILPKWYDSWAILDCFKSPIDVLELTNLSCTNSIWEIAVKDKLWFRKVNTVLLPVNFEFEQERTLREELWDTNVLRRSE